MRVIVLGDKNAIVAMRAQFRNGSPEAKICSAGAAIRDGNPAEAIRMLERLLTTIPRREQGLLVDFISALLTGRKEVVEAEKLLDSFEPLTPLEEALFSASRAVVFAMLGNAKASRRAARFAYDAIQRLDNDYAHIVVLFKLGRAATYRGEGAEALDLVLRSAQLASAAGYTRFAGIAYSSARDAAAILADRDRERLYAMKMLECGRRSDDVPTIIYGLVCQMGFAASAGDEDALRELTAEYQSYCLPRQYGEDLGAAYAMALPLAWRGDFAAFESAVKHFPDNPDSIVVAWRLSFLSLCAFVRGDIAAARVLSRQTLHRTAPESRSFAHDRIRRLSRTVAAFVCICIGDVHRGERVLASKDLAGSVEATILDPHRPDKAWAGYSKMLKAAVCHRAPVHQALTPSQTALVRKFASGMSIPEIARETGRSPATLRAQAHQINIRLGVKARARAVARARELRIL